MSRLVVAFSIALTGLLILLVIIVQVGKRFYGW